MCNTGVVLCNKNIESIETGSCGVSKPDIIAYLINEMNVDRGVLCSGVGKELFMSAYLCIFYKKKGSLFIISPKAISNLVWAYS